VLLDIGLPKLDGYAAATRIRRQTEEPIVIIALTGWGEPDDRRRTREAGFDAHLVKPVGYVDLSHYLAAAEARCP
jgi:CheY-like chemotaxis protein